MTEEQCEEGLRGAIQLYFNMMYDCDVSMFDCVFFQSAQLHGFRDGAMTMWSAPEYKQILADRVPPKSLDAPREEEILLMDFTSDNQAMAKVKVRIDAAVFIDYLTFHRVDGEWRITSKAYHLEESA